MKLRKGDTIALVGNSDPLDEKGKKEVEEISQLFISWGIQVEVSPLLLKGSTKPIEKAHIMNRYFEDDSIQVIFDVSGGNAANGVLPLLNYEAIQKSTTLFCGYSDVTTVLNAIHVRTNSPVELFQLRTIIWDKTGKQKERFYQSVVGEEDTIHQFSYSFVQRHSMEGKIVGGNIRCLLKLAGTPYFPQLKGKVLFLESLGGEEELVGSYFHQLSQITPLNELAGIVFGTFTQFEQTEPNKTVAQLFLETNPSVTIPIVQTNEIGHDRQSRALTLGCQIKLNDKVACFQPKKKES